MPRTRQLTREGRHEQLLALLRREGTVRIATLAKAFGVTTETARRDLDQLARSGALNRTYGGGASRSLTDEPPIGVRGRAHAAARTRIGVAAAALVADGDALMIDCGSTTTLFANALAARHLRLTVVTNCVPAARMLGTSARCRVILCPGDYVQHEGGVFGPDTLDFIARFRANRVFIGAGGVAVDGVTDADSASCAVKRAMMERSERAALLVDRSKFEIVQFEQVCPLEAIDDLVTDAAPPKRLAAALARARVKTIVADEAK
ncbi:MAG TPA: DeoR/GlpR family DNA-binding transcription regulator [Casimicrobiaceae bacterium]|nr:DeoR/GlpR family DNA-binding transcription regulator [Casimicrobiaceae bacterium]